jgi:hypothetical protein
MNTETANENEAPLPHNHGAKTRRIDLGLAILSASATPGASFTAEEISCWCDCTPAMVGQIEARALRKMRKKVSAQFNLKLSDVAGLRRWMALHFQP